MEEIYVNMEPVGQTASKHTGSNSSKERLCLCVALGILNVLLLAELIAISVRTQDMTADFSDISNFLTEQNSDSKFPSTNDNFTETTQRAEETSSFLQVLLEESINMCKTEKLYRSTSWTLKYITGDLFSCPRDESLAHCISEDCRMGAGIAVMFKKKFGRVSELKDQKKLPGQCAVLAHDQRFIYYLITKKKASQKPTYDSLRQSLEQECFHKLF